MQALKPFELRIGEKWIYIRWRCSIRNRTLKIKMWADVIWILCAVLFTLASHVKPVPPTNRLVHEIRPSDQFSCEYTMAISTWQTPICLYSNIRNSPFTTVSPSSRRNLIPLILLCAQFIRNLKKKPVSLFLCQENGKKTKLHDWSNKLDTIIKWPKRKTRHEILISNAINFTLPGHGTSSCLKSQWQSFSGARAPILECDVAGRLKTKTGEPTWW